MRSLCLMMMLIPAVLPACSHLQDQRQMEKTFAEANDRFHQGDFPAALEKYSEIQTKYPEKADRALFEAGILLAHPGNPKKDLQRSLESFQTLVKKYPASDFRQNSEMMIFNIGIVAQKDSTIAGQQAQIESLRNTIQARNAEIATLERSREAARKTAEELGKTIEELKRKMFDYAIRKRSVDRILVEKSNRRLMLISQGEVLKSYKIALGGDPVGPKERKGDNKTPEGIYFINGRNRDSRFHLSLRISYPNEKDKKRAKELGVSPGGDIMIHGIKNGFSWVGDAHSGIDWTKGCIAVTDEEIEEIDKAAPNGTVVEIRP